MVRVILEEAGHRVLEAADGQAALDVLRTGEAPDVFLLDAMMPRLDGVGFARAYRQLPSPHVPIIAISAVQELGTFAAQVGAVDMLPKPFSASTLIALVEQHAG
jgi:two-component system chemotaxis response regulator CheY